MYKVLGTPTGTTKNTLSVWIKRSRLGLGSVDNALVFGNSNAGGINLHSDDGVVFYNASGSLRTNRKLRDTSAWYNIIVVTDTTLSTASDRLKMYINGVRETSFLNSSNPSQNATSDLGSASEHIIGANNSPANYYDGLMSHVQMVDGLALAPTEFGSTDATTGEWEIKTSSYGTLGNNGFHITFDNPADIGASTNSNNFTPNANLKPTQDNPSNNFATLNGVTKGSSSTYSQGNLTATTAGAVYNTSVSSIGVTQGKWYWEVKLGNSGGSGGVVNYSQYGITTDNPTNVANLAAETVKHTYIKIAYGSEFRYNETGGSSTTINGYGSTNSGNDIVMMALDLDNNYLYMGVNGTWYNSGNPTSGSSGTGAAPRQMVSGLTYFPCFINSYGTSIQANFGNGYFGTTAVASAGTNASGNGIFEYDVPTGYTALSTKGLNL
jgi:hypothetical protein